MHRRAAHQVHLGAQIVVLAPAFLLIVLLPALALLLQLSPVIGEQQILLEGLPYQGIDELP